MIAAFPHLLRIAFKWCHWQHDPIVTDPAIVNYAAERSFVPTFLRLDTVGIDSVDDNVA